MKFIITSIFLLTSYLGFSQNIFFDYTSSSLEPTKIYHENGELKEIGKINNGKRVGKWIFYSENGIKLAECGFNDLGQKHGKWLIWDDNSKLRAQMFYKNGIRKGKWEVYNEHGELTIQKYY